MAVVDPALVSGVELLSLDAGNTVIFLDHARIAAILVREGHGIRAAALVRCEGDAKRRLESGEMIDVDWGQKGARGAPGWGAMLGTIVHLAGVPLSALPRVLDRLWSEHVRWNLYSIVPDGLGAALATLRSGGVKVVAVSNSEGMLEGLFERLGLLKCFDLVVDSAKVGVEKPDPRIFQIALAPYGVAHSDALHLGDTYATDVVGARAAGLRTALIDPHDHYAGRHLDVLRVPSVVEVAQAILSGC